MAAQAESVPDTGEGPGSRAQRPAPERQGLKKVIVGFRRNHARGLHKIFDCGKLDLARKDLTVQEKSSVAPT